MNKLKNLIWQYLQLALGILLASFGLKAFLLPNGFLDGGVTGIAILLNDTVGFNPSISLVLLNIPFFILAYYKISKKLVWNSVISVFALAILIEVENFTPITNDKLLISIFGGLFVGLGLGITISKAAVLDGAEILGIYLNEKFGIGLGKIILAFNIVLFSITAFIISVETALYSILTFVITAKVTDYIIAGFEDFIGLTIVSEKSEVIKREITEKIGAGITSYAGGKSTGANGEIIHQEILHTIISRIDIQKINNLINDIDSKAFVVEFDVNNVRGGVLRKYLGKKNKS